MGILFQCHTTHDVMANATKINAPEHDIEQVTVYGDRAVIRRKFPVEMQVRACSAVLLDPARSTLHCRP
ncbi:hypothetical protein BS47DRAFT_1341654, partial [Hydnum rufescens UP504]